MAAIYPSDYPYRDRPAAVRYFACGDRLDLAIMRNDGRSIKMLRYAQDILAMETREALEQERNRIKKVVDDLLAPLLNAFKHTPNT